MAIRSLMKRVSVPARYRWYAWCKIAGYSECFQSDLYEKLKEASVAADVQWTADSSLTFTTALSSMTVSRRTSIDSGESFDVICRINLPSCMGMTG